MIKHGKLWNEPPYLALITEPDACVDNDHANATLQAITSAIETSRVNLVSIRLTKPSDEDYSEIFERALQLTKRLVQLADESFHSFRVVCSSDWVELAIQANVHGIHVKESHLHDIPNIRKNVSRDDFIIGTSTHSVQSAKQSYETYCPDYYFVGTCFLTASHPEKSANDLEGPMLPGKVRNTLLTEANKKGYSCPIVLAIGGIDESNCQIPVSYGADGVAIIRAILQAPNPAKATLEIYDKMKSASTLVEMK